MFYWQVVHRRWQPSQYFGAFEHLYLSCYVIKTCKIFWILSLFGGQSALCNFCYCSSLTIGYKCTDCSKMATANYKALLMWDFSMFQSGKKLANFCRNCSIKNQEIQLFILTFRALTYTSVQPGLNISMSSLTLKYTKNITIQITVLYTYSS